MFLAALDELGFIRKDGEPPADAGKVRWQRLGRAAFSPVAWVVYCSIIIWAIVVMVRAPTLVPDYHDIFFTSYYTLIELGLFVGAIPLILLHESFHALAERPARTPVAAENLAAVLLHGRGNGD